MLRQARSGKTARTLENLKPPSPRAPKTLNTTHLLAYLPLLAFNKKLEDLPKDKKTAMAGVAQWIECWPTNQRVAGSVPSQGTCLGCGRGPQ